MSRLSTKLKLPALDGLTGSEFVNVMDAVPVEPGSYSVSFGAISTANSKLLEEKGKAQRYLDIAGVIMVALNADGKITLINKRGCEVLGYSEHELLGKNWFDTCIPDRMVEDVKKV